MKHCRSIPFVCLAVSLVFILAACSGPAALPPAPTAAPETATAVPPAPTSTPVPPPSPTAAPTQAPTRSPAAPIPTAAPSQTPLSPLAVAEDGFRIWCLPLDAPAAGQGGTEPPGNARVGAYSQWVDAVSVTIPASSCTLAYTFNQPVTQDVQLEAYYFYGGTPWLKAALSPAAENPNVATLTLYQPYVLDPPFWRVDYRFVVRVGDQEARSDLVSFNKSVQRCWEGSLPDPVTLACPKADVREPEPKPGITPSSPDYIK